jgi:outer membrane protein TolC
MIRIGILWSSLLLSVALCHADGGSAGGLPLPEDVLPQLRGYLEKAQTQSPRMLERKLDVLRAKADKYVAFSRSWVSISGSAQYNARIEKRYPATSYGFNDQFGYSVGASQPVWHWGVLEAARDIARINEDLAARRYAEAYRGLALEIRLNYQGLVLQRIALRNAQYQVELAQQNLERQKVRVAAKQIPAGYMAGDEMRLRETKLSASRAQSEMDYALATFRSLVGIDTLRVEDIPQTIGKVDTTATKSPVADAVPVKPEALVIAEKEVERAKLGVIGPKYNRYPKLNITAAVYRDEYTVEVINGNQSTTSRNRIDALNIGPQITWNIFDGFSTKGQKMAAYVDLKRAESQLATLRETLARDGNHDRGKIDFAWESYKIAQTRREWAEGGVTATKDQVKLGELPASKLDEAETSFNDSLYAEQAALAGYLNTCAAYLSSQGLDPWGHPASEPGIRIP